MEGTLPSSLKHIISNAEYYGPSLFLLATDVVAVYVFQEPSLLSSLQDVGLTDVVLHALLVKNVSSEIYVFCWAVVWFHAFITPFTVKPNWQFGHIAARL